MIEEFAAARLCDKSHRDGWKIQTIPLENIITITFRGRESRMLLAGTQELRMIDGGRIRGRFVKNSGDDLVVDTFCLGQLNLKLENLKGFVSLPQTGRAGRWAEEMLDEGKVTGEEQFLDQVIDRRGSIYKGVIRGISEENLDIDHDAMLKVVPIPIMYLAGGRMAPAARKAAPAATTDEILRISTRDGSRLDGRVNKISLGHWELRPVWNPEISVNVLGEEITDIQVLNSKRLYLSQLVPVKVKESTKLAPPQPYRMDRSCQGDAITIGRHSYPWGIGVHANSELTFSLGKSFKTFQAVTGIDSHVGNAGSVIFSVFWRWQGTLQRFRDAWRRARAGGNFRRCHRY